MQAANAFDVETKLQVDAQEHTVPTQNTANGTAAYGDIVIEIPDAAKIALYRDLGILFSAINADDSHSALDALNRMRATITPDDGPV